MTRMRLSLLATAACCVAATLPLAAARAQGTRLLRHPSITRDAVAFEYGGDLWSVSRAGGSARRLTSTPEMDTDAAYSPDGTQIAFTHMSGAGGGSDVYVMAAADGDARRLTFYPGVNRVRGWTPDGKRVVFATDRASVPQASFLRLFTISIDGGAAEVLPMPRAFTGSFSPDGRRIAYEEIATVFVPGWFEQSAWRHYRGGRTHPISIMNLADHSVEKLPWKDSNDSDPVWVGNTVYFLSDRNFTTNVFSYRVDTKELKQLTTHDDFDVANLSATDDGVVYEQGGWLHLIDPRTGTARQLAVDVAGDFAWARPQFKKVAPMIREAELSPTGARAVFEARGDIFTMPAEKGDWRNITRSAGAHDHSPAWSPDGSQIAWLSDQSGEFQLMIGDQLGATKPRTIALPTTGFFSQLAWSPDGKHVNVQDNHLNLYVIDLATEHATKIDTDTYNTPGRSFDAAWSPDSRWLTYSKSLPSHMRAIFVRSLAADRSFQLSDAFADASSPAFDAGGRYLYFL
ncbi:MAG: peptidase, partial [Gemmatimonadetes bacterium]|nr:peptidase [Gemmatimonadota bacterium]